MLSWKLSHSKYYTVTNYACIEELRRQICSSSSSWDEMFWLTAAMDGLEASPAGGWVTSAPRKITGSRNRGGLKREKRDKELSDSGSDEKERQRTGRTYGGDGGRKAMSGGRVRDLRAHEYDGLHEDRRATKQTGALSIKPYVVLARCLWLGIQRKNNGLSNHKHYVKFYT